MTCCVASHLSYFGGGSQLTFKKADMSDVMFPKTAGFISHYITFHLERADKLPFYRLQRRQIKFLHQLAELAS